MFIEDGTAIEVTGDLKWDNNGNIDVLGIGTGGSLLVHGCGDGPGGSNNPSKILGGTNLVWCVGASSSCSSSSSGESPGGCDALASLFASSSKTLALGNGNTSTSNSRIALSRNTFDLSSFYIDNRNENILEIQIYDMSGARVQINQQTEGEKLHIKPQNITAGIHVIMIYTKEGVFVERTYLEP